VLGASAAGNATCTKKGDLLALLSKDSGAKTKAGIAASETQIAAATAIDSLSDDTIRWHLRAALSELEVRLGIPMGIEIIKSLPIDEGLVKGVDYDRAEPRRPFTRSDQRNWFQIPLAESVISIERVRAYWFGTLVWEISTAQENVELVTLEWKTAGSAHILPTALSNLLITSPIGGGDFGAFQLINGWASPLPDVWSVDYTRGPMTKTGEVGQVEAVLAHWCYCAAGILLLSQGGLAQSKGLTNASVSIDGLSRSVGLQASAIYGINSSLEEAYKKSMERIDWKRLRIYKRGLRIRPYGR
tara:strand:- start:20052 stop:20954 length:903 start_codon:yes stop_codon:yes gene_type:complete